MADPDNNEAPSSSTINRDSSEAASSSFPSNYPQVREEENENNRHQFRSPEPEPQEINILYQENNPVFYDAVSVIRGDTWSCVFILLTFWFFVSLTMILGIYGSQRPGLLLYGFYESPPLDVVIPWAEVHNVSVPVDSHKEWIYFLNQGTQINISYRVNSPSSSIFLIIAEGYDGLARWLEDPTYPNTTLSWNLIHGSGMITQNIFRSSSYYLAVGNLNEEVEVELNLTIRALLYNTSEAYYQCDLSHGSCGLSIFFTDGSAAVLRSSGPKQNTSNDKWYVKLSYGPRWITYILGFGGMTLLMFLAYNFLNKFQSSQEVRGGQYGEIAPERAPLISHKDDDLSSWGSSYDCLSHDEDDFEQFLTGLSVEGMSCGRW
ncbi:RING/U-box superfamily protein [Quillaja saponaria]|uniref:RING/U-box superfamily protein n=1 Tax=Quillaja saponaria TaxID=32244 RepID=A0AAD7LN65_QUISA|nr:RING/U-box superfamily protein [Quillaja saponaria]